ncbi:hypothetical protein INS49_010103 [Diaporthe citri]|uniref:uncharacterized protein n=1 Tax=Diaporthe citri TaxID=83186 RepID=UPI001C824F69|nr:uncharacterized protein INS49_010103 [Diaporthe citri]KAG6361874.1 hypothetical protein INS49_010103 [Diaporthe citri]
MSSVAGNEEGRGHPMRSEEPGLRFDEQNVQNEAEQMELAQFSRSQPSEQPVIEFAIAEDTRGILLKPNGFYKHGGLYFNIHSWRYEPFYQFVQPDPRTSCIRGWGANRNTFTKVSPALRKRSVGRGKSVEARV